MLEFAVVVAQWLTHCWMLLVLVALVLPLGSASVGEALTAFASSGAASPCLWIWDAAMVELEICKVVTQWQSEKLA